MGILITKERAAARHGRVNSRLTKARIPARPYQEARTPGAASQYRSGQDATANRRSGRSWPYIGSEIAHLNKKFKRGFQVISLFERTSSCLGSGPQSPDFMMHQRRLEGWQVRKRRDSSSCSPREASLFHAPAHRRQNICMSSRSRAACG